MNFNRYMKRQCLAIHRMATALEITDDEAALLWVEFGLATEYAEAMEAC